MRQGGVEVVGALPVNPIRMLLSRLDLRNHRKIAVIDGQIGYTGSNNLAEAALCDQTRFRPLGGLFDQNRRSGDEGTADPLSGGLAFRDRRSAGDSAEETAHEVRERTAGTDHRDRPELLQRSDPLRSSRPASIRQLNELVLTTPYFVPDETTIKNLCVCARRGVQTTLVVPARNDSWMVAAASRSNYAPLLKAGVDIHEFNGGLLHAKTITIDREIGIVMSANLDRRSFKPELRVRRDHLRQRLRRGAQGSSGDLHRQFESNRRVGMAEEKRGPPGRQHAGRFSQSYSVTSREIELRTTVTRRSGSTSSRSTTASGQRTVSVPRSNPSGRPK